MIQNIPKKRRQRGRQAYCMIEGYDQFSFESQVNQCVDDGYIPIGGVSITIDPDSGLTIYAQALWDPH